MTWLEILVVVAIGFVVFKFVVKPIFKIIGIVLLVLVAWWLYNGM